MQVNGLSELAEVYLGADPDRALRRAGNSVRANTDTIRLLLTIALDLRALREALAPLEKYQQ